MPSPSVSKQPHTKKEWLKTASTLLFIVLVALLALYVWHERQDMAKLLSLSWQTSTLLLLLGLGACIVNCLYHLVILQTYGIPMSLTDWMGVVCVSNAIAYVLPMRADLVFSAAYYKRVKNLSYTKSVSMAAGNIVFGTAFSLLQIFIALCCIGFLDKEWPALLWAVWAFAAIALAVFIVLSLLVQNKSPKLLQKHKLLREVMDGFAALLRNRTLLGRLLACMVGNNVFQILLYTLCFRAIGLPVTLYKALFYNSVSWLASIVAIVPGNVGIKESVMGISTLLMGMSFQDGVAVSLLHRMAIMVVYLLTGLAFAIPVYRKFTRERTAWK